MSAWEIAVKHRLGKLPNAQQIVANYHDLVARLDGKQLPITSQHALLAGDLDWGHRDPFDRILAAQALCGGWPIISCDAAFATLPGVRLIW